MLNDEKVKWVSKLILIFNLLPSEEKMVQTLGYLEKISADQISKAVTRVIEQEEFLHRDTNIVALIRKRIPGCNL